MVISSSALEEGLYILSVSRVLSIIFLDLDNELGRRVGRGVICKPKGRNKKALHNLKQIVRLLVNLRQKAERERRHRVMAP